MNETLIRDYGESGGYTVRTAMLDHVKRFPDKKTRPKYIYWSGLRIQTSDYARVPQKGLVRVEFLSTKGDAEQGCDIKFDDGWIELAQGERISHLRTWRDERLDDIVEYPFLSRDGLLWTWNVYKMRYPNGQVIEEKWTENAGFWLEQVSENARVYHCSHGMATPPDFESLVYKVQIG